MPEKALNETTTPVITTPACGRSSMSWVCYDGIRVGSLLPVRGGFAACSIDSIINTGRGIPWAKAVDLLVKHEYALRLKGKTQATIWDRPA